MVSCQQSVTSPRLREHGIAGDGKLHFGLLVVEPQEHR